MAGDRYVISDQHACHHLTFTVVDWMDVFTRRHYKDIITDGLQYCIREKGLELFAWVLMSNHLHLVARTHSPHPMSRFICDFKKHSSKQLAAAIETGPESRREWMLLKMQYWARATGRAKHFKFWTDDNHAVLLERTDRLVERIHYNHQNPVRQGIVEHPHEYRYSSARDYAGLKGLVPVTVIDDPRL